jgi:DNA-binding response OmpR family regulator
VSAVGIVLVDDHPAVRAGLEGLLDEDDGVRILATAATSRDGYEAITTLRPDAVVVDHHLPDESGLALCLRVQALERPPRVVVYSAFADARLRVLGVIAGAVAVIPKSAAPDDVLAAVRGDDPTPRGGGQLTARALREVGSGLDAGDLAILGMLAHGVGPADIASTLSIDEAWLTARRWAMLERIATPGRRLPLRTARHGLQEVALPA